MKNIVYVLTLTFLLSTDYLFAQSSCASMVKNIGFEKRAGSIEYVTKINTTTALFYAEDQYYGKELWRTDGTSNGTVLAKDIAPGTRSSRNGYKGITGLITPSDIAGDNKPVVLNGVMYFEANDGIHGYEIWRSDGTESGTFAITNTNENGNFYRDDQSFRGFFSFNNEVYFWDHKKRASWRLYKSTGTVASTVLVGEFQEEQFYSDSKPKLFIFRESLSFRLGPSSYDNKKAEPNRFFQISASGTVSKSNLHPDGIFNIGVSNNQLFFSNKKGLFRSDGTASGTFLVRENGSVFTGVSSSSEFWGDGNLTYFISADDLCRTDGTTAGTFAIQNNLRFSNNDLEFETRIFLYKNELYFVDYGTKNNFFKGVKLWKTDGSLVGTKPVVDIDIDAKGQSIIRLVTEVDGTLYFYGKIDVVTADLDNKMGIWKSDGTQAGTKIICPLGPNLACSYINPTFEDYGFISLNNSLLFLGTPTGFVENYGDIELYRTNLTNCPSIKTTVVGAATFCAGSSTNLSATSSGGTAPYTYRWQQGSVTVGSSTSSLTINSAGTYTITATDANGCVGSAQIAITQRTGPAVTMSSNTAVFCAGQSAVLTASASGSASPYTYQWRQGSATVGSSAASLTVNTGGTYSVTAIDAAGCTSPTVSATVTQRSAPTATITASAPGFTVGGSVTLTASASPDIAYQWLRDGQPISGATQSVYTATQPGNYAVVLAGSECSTTSSALAVSLITALEESLSGIDFEVSASPNPTQGVVEIQLKNQQSKPVSVMLIMYDLTGRTVYQQQIKLNSVKHAQHIDLSQHPTGLYLLNATTDQQQTSLRLVRE